MPRYRVEYIEGSRRQCELEGEYESESAVRQAFIDGFFDDELGDYSVEIDSSGTTLLEVTEISRG